MTVLFKDIKELDDNAHNLVSDMFKKQEELVSIHNALQPLLYELSVKLYGEDSTPVTLIKLIEDSIKLIKGE